MIEGKVLKRFNDAKNNLKTYKPGDKFKAEDNRYKQLKSDGFVDDGKAIAEKMK